jgi:hypothetical protein
VEVIPGDRTLPFVQFGIVDHQNAALPERGQQFAAPAFLPLRDQFLDLAPDCDELRRGTHAVRADVERAGFRLGLQSRHAHHEEFVEIRSDNGEKLHPLEQRIAFVQGFLDHALLKRQQAQFTIDVEGRIPEIDLAVCGRRRQNRQLLLAGVHFTISLPQSTAQAAVRRRI